MDVRTEGYLDYVEHHWGHAHRDALPDDARCVDALIFYDLLLDHSLLVLEQDNPLADDDFVQVRPPTNGIRSGGVKTDVVAGKFDGGAVGAVWVTEGRCVVLKSPVGSTLGAQYLYSGVKGENYAVLVLLARVLYWRA